MEHACLDRVQHLRGEMKEPDTRRAVALGSVLAELRLLRLGQHVEARPQVLLVAEASHRPVAVDRELKRLFGLEVRVLASSRLKVHHHDPAVGVPLDRSNFVMP